MNLPEILSQYQIPYQEVGHRNVREGWIGIDCPRCGKGSQKYHLGINLEGRFANCWKCGSIPLTTALVELTGEPYYAISKLVKALPVTHPIVRPRGQLQLPDRIGELGLAHLDYLRSRQLDPDQMRKLWGLKGIGIHPRLSWRIFIPVYHRGEIVSWTTRSISNKVPARYISARPTEESLPLSSILFGEDYVRHVIIVTEGPFDVFRIGPGAVALSGVSNARRMVRAIAKYPIRIICFDAEKAAQRRAEHLCRELALFPGRTERVILDAPDPGSADEAEIHRLRRAYLT